MIRVNLLHNIGMAQGVAAEQAVEVSGEAARIGFAKLVVILLFPLVLYIYEKINLKENTELLETAQQRVEAIKRERSKLGDAAPRIEKYNKEKQRIDKELDVLRGISRNRLREVKALDAIQSLIPPQTWIRKITIDGNIAKLEGNTTADDGIPTLIHALESNVYFTKIEPKSTSQDGATKKFEIEFRVGRQEGGAE